MTFLEQRRERSGAQGSGNSKSFYEHVSMLMSRPPLKRNALWTPGHHGPDSHLLFAPDFLIKLSTFPAHALLSHTHSATLCELASAPRL